jgi:hypothetical protein
VDISEFLREQKRNGEVNQQKHGNEQRDCSDEVDLHGLPQFLASLDVEKRHGKENGSEKQHDQVLHGRYQSSPAHGRDLAGRAGAKIQCCFRRAVKACRLRKSPLSRFWRYGDLSAQKIF